MRGEGCVLVAVRPLCAVLILLISVRWPGAAVKCNDCDKQLCNDCNELLHKSAKKKEHVRVALAAGGAAAGAGAGAKGGALQSAPVGNLFAFQLAHLPVSRACARAAVKCEQCEEQSATVKCADCDKSLCDVRTTVTCVAACLCLLARCTSDLRSSCVPAS